MELIKYSKLFLLVCKRFFLTSEKYVIYKYNFSDSENLVIDSEIKIYETINEIPATIQKELSIYPLINTLYYRLKSRKAILLVILNGNHVIAFGWIQSWKYFIRKFGWLTNEGLMLGPYWTDPNYRGKGYYGQLLRKSIEIAQNIKQKIIIYTNLENISSQRGIEKAGFEKIGVYKIIFLFRMFCWKKKLNVIF